MQLGGNKGNRSARQARQQASPSNKPPCCEQLQHEHSEAVDVLLLAAGQAGRALYGSRQGQHMALPDVSVHIAQQLRLLNAGKEHNAWAQPAMSRVLQSHTHACLCRRAPGVSPRYIKCARCICDNPVLNGAVAGKLLNRRLGGPTGIMQLLCLGAASGSCLLQVRAGLT